MNLASLIGFLPWISWLDDFGALTAAPTLDEVEECEADRNRSNDLEAPEKPGTAPEAYPVVDLEASAAGVEYRSGKIKRTRYAPVDLSKRTVLIGLHQAGVERGEARWLKSAHRVTCHRAIGPAGNRYRVHPLDRRLVCTNRLDRAPYHCIGIEVLGNFKGTFHGRWYKPSVFGSGTVGQAQLIALRQEIVAICDEVERDYEAVVVGIAPHRTVGRGSSGRPNRQICCGFEVWSGAGEWAGAELGLRVPGPDWAKGGLPIPSEWHGEYWPRCDRRLA